MSGLRHPQLDRKTSGNAENQRQDDGLDVAKAAVLQIQHEKHVGRRQAHAPQQRNAEQQLQRNGRAEHFGEVAGGDRDLADDPEREGRSLGVGIAAGLREIASAGDAEPRRERLQQNRHEVRQHDDAEQRVAELCAARDVGRPVAGIHVADGHEVSRPCEGEHLSPGGPADRNRDGAVHFRQAAPVPHGIGCGSVGGFLHESRNNSIMTSRVASTASTPHRAIAHRQLLGI